MLVITLKIAITGKVEKDIKLLWIVQKNMPLSELAANKMPYKLTLI